MKFKRKNQKVDVKLPLPQDLPWKILGFVIKDLGFDKVTTGSMFYDCKVSEVLDAIRSRDPKRLLSLVPFFEPQCMLENGLTAKRNACLFSQLYQVGSLLKKYPFPGMNTREKAFEKFLQVEHSCKLYNEENFKALLVLSEKHPKFYGVLEELREDILSVLGEYPDFDCIASHACHGPGVSLGDYWKEGRSTEFYKWKAIPYTVTASTSPLAKTAILADPRWIGALDDWYRFTQKVPTGRPIDLEHFWGQIFKIVPGSETTSVPKTAEIDRTIAKEPELNVFLQLGVDYELKRRIRATWGYDLHHQERNQKLAFQASCGDIECATLDMAAASDTVTLKICELLLPPAWFDLLWDLRCPVTTMGSSKPIILSKISSMGNGFTFALESLIFASLVRLAIRRTRSRKISAVYGDDLVVPVAACPFLHELLSLCGFKLNEKKSFVRGPFRESCGHDYFHGYNVRPILLTSKTVHLKDLFLLHNKFVRQEELLPWVFGTTFEHTRQYILRLIPVGIRRQFYGPMSESEDCYLFSPKRLTRNKWNQRVIWQIIAKPKKFSCGFSEFYFRKLMVNLGPKRPRSKWDAQRRFDTGNAFDITRRGIVQFICTKVSQL